MTNYRWYMPLIFISSGTWQWNWIFFFFFLDWTCNENAGVNGKQTYANRLLVGWRMQKAFDRTGVAGQSRHPLSWRTNQVNMQLYLMTDDKKIKNLWLENTQDRVYLLFFGIFRPISTSIICNLRIRVTSTLLVVQDLKKEWWYVCCVRLWYYLFTFLAYSNLKNRVRQFISWLISG